jgi:hypothetical protein
VQVTPPPGTPIRAPRCDTTGPARTLDRHPNYILPAYMAFDTRPTLRLPRLMLRETPDIAEDSVRLQHALTAF